MPADPSSTVPPALGSGPVEARARVLSAKTVVGALIAADLLIGRGLVSGDENGVALAGRPLDWVCAFRRQTGLPCPTCGMTRSVVLALHGEWWRAWRLSPGGVALVAGLVAAATALLGLGAIEWLGKAHPRRAEIFLRRAALIYAGGAIAVWLGGWMAQLAAAWPGH
ncbi:MAG: DUF2752 domain-containing protein [Bryobacteraceae bacterium]